MTTPTAPETVLTLWKASRALEARALESIADTGLGASDFKVLEALLHKGALPVNVLGRTLLLTSGSITTAVDRLADRGLVARHGDATDRRVRQVALTGAGRALIEPIYARHAADLEAVVRVLSDAERGTLVALLRKLGLHAMTAAGTEERP